MPAVPTIERVRDFATGTLLPGARSAAVVVARATCRLASAAHRALSRENNSAGFEVKSAALHFDNGGVVEFPARTAERIAAFDVEWLGDLGDDVESPRLEIRYVLDGKKFRAIATRQKNPKIVVGGRPRAPKVLAVELVPRSGLSEDVTARFLKYAGPAGDFHGTPVRVSDVFPNRDVEAMEEVGYSLAVTDRMMNERVVPFSGRSLAADVLSA